MSSYFDQGEPFCVWERTQFIQHEFKRKVKPGNILFQGVSSRSLSAGVKESDSSRERGGKKAQACLYFVEDFNQTPVIPFGATADDHDLSAKS